MLVFVQKRSMWLLSEPKTQIHLWQSHNVETNRKEIICDGNSIYFIAFQKLCGWYLNFPTRVSSNHLIIDGST